MKVDISKVNWISVEDRNGKTIQVKPGSIEMKTMFGEKFLHIKE